MIPAELELLLEPLERFETIRARAARLGNRVCDLSYANPYSGIHGAARTAMRDALDDDRTLSFQYSPFGGQTLIRRKVADALSESHVLPFTYRHVILTPGAMSALQIALHEIGAPGDEVLIPVPCWLDHPLYARHAGRVARLIELSPPNFNLDAPRVLSAVSPRTAAVLLTHPSNPTGRLYSPDSLLELAVGLQEREERWGRPITLIADETHRDFTAVDAYRSPAEFYPRTLVVYSFGKYHFMQGQRLGYLAVSPRSPTASETASALVRWTRITGIATPTALMQRAVPALLAAEYDYSWVASWRAQVVNELTAAGYEVVPPDATLFVYVGTPPGEEDFEFVERLAARGVLVLPGPVFHHQGYFRVSVTGSEDMLQRGLSMLRDLWER